MRGKKNILFLLRLLFNYSRYCSKEKRGQGNNSPKARLDKGSSIGRVTSRSRRRPAAGRHGMLQENNKQKFARNFGFKMILAGGYQMRAVAVMRSFPMYGYKVMINFRTSSFTDCSRVLPSLFLGLTLLSVSSYVLIPLLPFFLASAIFPLGLLFGLFLRRKICNNFCYVSAEIRKSLRKEVYFLPTDKTTCRNFELPIIAQLCYLLFLPYISLFL